MISQHRTLDLNSASFQSKDLLFYDGSCPLCSKEMKALSKQKAASLELLDIHQVADWSGFPSKQTMLRKLHLRRVGGEWIVGLEANVYAWRGTRVAWFWRLLTLPGIRYFANHAYDFWAERRFKNLKRKCSTDSCQC